MKRHRTSLTATIAALTIAALAPAAAGANPLLSGYGGPGQGNQAILGSALLNGRGGGSGSSGGSGGSSIAAASGEAAINPSPRPGGRIATSTPKRRDASGKAGKGSKSGSFAHRSPLRPRTAVVRDVSQPLGLSGIDLLYLFLASGALVLTGAITRRMARRAH